MHAIADIVLPGWVIEVKKGLRSSRNLRANLMELAYLLAENRDVKGALVLDEPGVTHKRLDLEWHEASKGIPNGPAAEIRRVLADSVTPVESVQQEVLPRPDYYTVVLKLLVHRWLTGRGPASVRRLQGMAGCSYPTVASALDRLEQVITRSPSRGVALTRFPTDTWRELLAIAHRVRSTIRYADRSGQPITPSKLAQRLEALSLPGVAVGGVLGAIRYDPDLDLTGAPRLDLSIHSPAGKVNLDFVKDLDPALKRVDGHGERAHATIHFVRRSESLFEVDEVGRTWADPVECLLDLHEMRFESQAAQFVRRLESAEARKPFADQQEGTKPD
jgi:hypothetical protein